MGVWGGVGLRGLARVDLFFAGIFLEDGHFGRGGC